MSPTCRHSTCWRWKSGERMKPTIGIPSNRVTTAPTAWVPRKANWRRLSRRGSRRAIANESVKHAGGAEDDEEQNHRDGAPHQPEGQGRLAVRLAEPASQAEGGDADEEQGEADHDDADQRQVEVGLEVTHGPHRALPQRGRGIAWSWVVA